MSAWTCCRRSGINAEPRFTDWGSMLQSLAKTEPVEQGGWSAFLTYWSGLDQFDPAVHVWIRGNGRAGARGWPDSPRLEALRDAWLSAGDLAAQKQIAADIQRQAFVDVPYIPLGQILPTWAYQRNVTGRAERLRAVLEPAEGLIATCRLRNAPTNHTRHGARGG